MAILLQSVIHVVGTSVTYVPGLYSPPEKVRMRGLFLFCLRYINHSAPT